MFYINFEKSFTLACAFFYAQASAQAPQPPSFTPRGGCGQSFNPHPWGNLFNLIKNQKKETKNA